MSWDLCSIYLFFCPSPRSSLPDWKDALDQGDDIFLSTASKPAVLFRPIGDHDFTDVHFQVFENRKKSVHN